MPGGGRYREEGLRLNPGELGVLVVRQKRQRKENKPTEGVWKAKEENVSRRGYTVFNTTEKSSNRVGWA